MKSTDQNDDILQRWRMRYRKEEMLKKKSPSSNFKSTIECGNVTTNSHSQNRILPSNQIISTPIINNDVDPSKENIIASLEDLLSSFATLNQVKNENDGEVEKENSELPPKYVKLKKEEKRMEPTHRDQGINVKVDNFTIGTQTISNMIEKSTEMIKLRNEDKSTQMSIIRTKERNVGIQCKLEKQNMNNLTLSQSDAFKKSTNNINNNNNNLMISEDMTQTSKNLNNNNNNDIDNEEDDNLTIVSNFFEDHQIDQSEPIIMEMDGNDDIDNVGIAFIEHLLTSKKFQRVDLNRIHMKSNGKDKKRFASDLNKMCEDDEVLRYLVKDYDKLFRQLCSVNSNLN
ncbi:hypothetical protein SNEBB_001923 [Seison nebaliae]|nr:hypothetical protein SNEBB_001923 [Seison nebaliae]